MATFLTFRIALRALRRNNFGNKLFEFNSLELFELKFSLGRHESSPPSQIIKEHTRTYIHRPSADPSPESPWNFLSRDRAVSVVKKQAIVVPVFEFRRAS